MYCIHKVCYEEPLNDEFQRFLARNPNVGTMAASWRKFLKRMNACYALLNMSPDSRRVPSGWSPSDLLASVVQNIMNATRSDFMSRLMDTLTQHPRAAAGVTGKRNTTHQEGRVFQAMIRDQPVRMRFIDRNFIDMIQSLSPDPIQSPGLGFALRIAIAVKNLLTVGITATPEFGIKNAIRDTLSTVAPGRRPQAPWGTLTGAKEELVRSEIGKDWLLQGGGFGSFYDHVLELEPAQNPRLTVPRFDTGSRAVSWLKWCWNLYTLPFRALESGSRITQYRKMLESGATKRQAMMQSRQISTDFADRGAGTVWRNYCRTVPF